MLRVAEISSLSRHWIRLKGKLYYKEAREQEILC